MARRRYYILQDGARLYKDTLEAISQAAKREANRIKEPVQVHYEERDAFDRPGRRGAAARHTPSPAGRLAYARNPAPPKLKAHVGSWFIVDRATGKTVAEIFKGDKRINTLNPKYEAVPADVALARLSKPYTRNPVNPHLARAGTEMLSFLRGRDITATQAKAIRKIAEKAPAKRAASSLPRGKKGSPRAASKDGYNAFLDGHAASANPYEPGEIGYSMWRTGYLDAKEGNKRNFARNPATKASKARKTASNKRGAFVEYIDGATKKRIKYGNKGIATIRAKAMIADGWRGVRVLSA